MRILAVILLIAAVAPAQVVPWGEARPDEKHPRLILTPSQVGALRQAVEQPGAHHRRVLAAMKQRVDIAAEDLAHGPRNLARATLAREAAVIYVITDDLRYATLAYEALRLIDQNPGERGLPDRGDGLSRAAAGLAFALCYDWCYNGWTILQRDAIRGRILDSLDAWPDYGHSTFGGDKVSYWNAVCRSSELIMMLATYQERSRDRRLEDIKEDLRQHMRSAYGPTGLSQEGLGAVAEACLYMAPAVYALRSIGDNSLDGDFDAQAWWKLALFTSSMVTAGEDGRRMLQSGVSPSVPGDRGWLSVLIPTVPRERLAHYLWFYDRTVGVDAADGEGDDTCFDARDAGGTWALLCYPTDGKADDPGASLGHTLADAERGAYLFRNQWRNHDDVLISLSADARSQGFAWDRPEALNLSVIAFGQPFISGPAKQRRSSYVSTLLVDGRADRGRGADGDTGLIDSFATTNDGGYAIVGGGTQYKSLGMDDVRRHLLVDFSGRCGYDLFATLDRVVAADDRPHDYTYQLNIGDEQGDAGLAVTTGEEAGRVTFLLTAGDGAFCKGWVVAPRDATIQAGDPLRIDVRGVNTEIWVTMVVGRGDPPTATFKGEGLNSALHLGEAVITYDAQADRLVHE